MTSRMRVTAVLVGLLGLAVGLGVSGRSAQRASSDHEKAPYSRPRLKVRMENNVRIPMRDRVELSADIYRPDAEGRFPTILSRTPYSNGGPGTAAGAKFYAERGYVVVLQDTRGRHDSDGKFYPFRHEPDDGYDTDQWVGRQPWSNGRIGTMGGSYVGFTQLSQAIRGSQYLTAMVPNVTTLDIYGNWIYTGGAFQYGFALSWGANRIDGRVQQEVNPHDWPQVFRHLPILTADEALGRRSLHYRDWVRHPTRDSYWDNNSFENAHAQITVPILNITGWYDIFLVGLLKDHVEITKHAKTAVARNNKRMMIGPWVHSVGSRSNVSSERSGEKSLDFGPEAEVDVEGVQLRWFDYWLKGVDNGVGEESPIKIFVMGENRWRYEQEWPLERTQYTKYYFRSGGHANSLYGDGTLSQAPRRGGAPSDTYTYDSSDPNAGRRELLLQQRRPDGAIRSAPCRVATGCPRLHNAAADRARGGNRSYYRQTVRRHLGKGYRLDSEVGRCTLERLRPKYPGRDRAGTLSQLRPGGSQSDPARQGVRVHDRSMGIEQCVPARAPYSGRDFQQQFPAL